LFSKKGFYLLVSDFVDEWGSSLRLLYIERWRRLENLAVTKSCEKFEDRAKRFFWCFSEMICCEKIQTNI